ncbi:MAG: hypothetical protein H0U86_10030 [Chloroflexi bacterium]|nr:hypothetical protein [Chloroflexota bacterium]
MSVVNQWAAPPWLCRGRIRMLEGLSSDVARHRLRDDAVGTTLRASAVALPFVGLAILVGLLSVLLGPAS